LANKFIVPDPGVCIGCKTCMAACLAKHDRGGEMAIPRLSVTYTLTVSAPVACHHCMDAPCVNACPVGALYEDPANHRVAIRQERCIGCRSCVMACPFGAVDIVTRTEPLVAGCEVFGTHEKAYVIKCDLCVDRPEGPACVQACLTKSLRLMDEDELARMQAQKRTDAVAGAGELSSIAGARIA
jgi:electron transport protein HydN